MMPLLDKLREQYGGGPLCSELHIRPVNVLPLSATATSSG
ncbi:transposase for insertion sequence element IS3411 domain protein [Shigella flexneri 2a str. 2457T]|nr:transposase for insertion sequence element IS3411 domain protein [Shigella flexneri 2a str. 2457T]